MIAIPEIKYRKLIAIAQEDGFNVTTLERFY